MEGAEIACIWMNQSKHPAVFSGEMTLSAFGVTVYRLFPQPCTHGTPDLEPEHQYVGNAERVIDGSMSTACGDDSGLGSLYADSVLAQSDGGTVESKAPSKTTRFFPDLKTGKQSGRM